MNTQDRARLNEAAQIAAGSDFPEKKARAAVRRAIDEDPNLMSLPAQAIARRARMILAPAEALPATTARDGLCLACAGQATADVDGADLCAGHEPPFRRGVERAIDNAKLVAPGQEK